MQTLKSIDILEINKHILKNKTIQRVPNSNYVKIWELGMYYYSGEVDSNNEFNNYGEIIYYNHPYIKSYKGNFINGNKEGKSQEIYTNDDIYDGMFIDNKRNGYGKLYSNNGILKYEGDWINDKIIGKITGFDYNKYGNKIYFGQMEDAKYNGFGIIMNNGNIIQYALYKDNEPISKLDFYDQKDLVVKEYPSTLSLDDLKNFYNDLNSTDNISILEKYQDYLLNKNSTNIIIQSADKNVIYMGEVKFIKQNTNSNYIYHGIGIFNNKSITKPNELISYSGTFSDGLFSNGEVYTKKHGFKTKICSGTFKKLECIDNTYETIVKNLLNGELHETLKRRIIHTESKFNTDKYIFEGSFINGRPSEGKVYNLGNNNIKSIVYEGSFEINDTNIPIGDIYKYSGFGTEYYAEYYVNNKIKYEGNFKKGVYNGDGILFHSNNGTINYTGLFVDGLKHGYGYLFNENSDLVYEGEFSNNNIL